MCIRDSTQLDRCLDDRFTKRERSGKLWATADAEEAENGTIEIGRHFFHIDLLFDDVLADLNTNGNLFTDTF